jgi:hypothetical protein
MAAFLVSILERPRSDRTAASFVETSNPPHQRRGGMAALAVPALCVNLPAAEPHYRLRSPENPQPGDKANGKFLVETIVWRKPRGPAAAAFPCFPRFHPLSETVGYGRYPIHVMFS